MDALTRLSAWMTPYAVVWVVGLALGAAGCKGNRGGQTLPAPVERAEALAEDVQDDLDRNAWPAAEAKLRELRATGEKLASVGVARTKRSAYGNALDSLDAAITRRSLADALTAGNHVSRVVTGIMADYPTKVPAHVALMDVAGRDVLYAAQQGRWSDAANAAAEAGRSYAPVQAHVKASNPALDQRVTSEMEQLQRAVASRARDRVASLAQALLEDVDHIEQTF